MQRKIPNNYQAINKEEKINWIKYQYFIRCRERRRGRNVSTKINPLQMVTDEIALQIKWVSFSINRQTVIDKNRFTVWLQGLFIVHLLKNTFIKGHIVNEQSDLFSPSFPPKKTQNL